MLESARLKVQWANHHIDQLNLYIGQYIESHRDVIAVQQDADACDTGIKTGAFAPLSPIANLLAGSTAQLLRCSLDHAASEVIHRINGVDYRTTFPIHETRDRLEKSKNLRTIEKASPDLSKVILDEITPTKTGNYPIWAINRLANTDKHRTLILLTPLTGYSTKLVRPGQPTPVNFTFVDATRDEKNIFSTIGHSLEEGSNVDPVLEILIGETDAFHKQALIPTLTDCSHVMTKTLDTIEAVLDP